MRYWAGIDVVMHMFGEKNNSVHFRFYQYQESFTMLVEKNNISPV